MATKKYKLTSMVDLKPAPANRARKIKKIAASGLGKSIDTFGDISGITWNKRTGNLVAGHQRVAQLRKRGAKIITRKNGNVSVVAGDKIFPVRIVDWDRDFETAANLEANNRQIAGDFNSEIASVLSEVESSLSELQFEELRFDDLTREVGKSTRGVSRETEMAFAPKYLVMVTCNDEVEQSKLLERLDGEGYSVKALMS